MEPRSSPKSAEARPLAGAFEPEYSNPPVAEDINAPDRRHVRSFLINLAVIAGAILLFVAALNIAAEWVMPLVPFGWEEKAVGPDLLAATLDADGKARQEELRRIAGRLAEAMDFPPGVRVVVHYNPSPVPNAFATFGGNIVIFQGMLDMLEHEDGVAMVLAHEMAHIRHRDPIKGVLRALGLALLYMGVGDAGIGVQGTAGVGMASYSRAQERAADDAAVQALGAVYGHAGGAAELFGQIAAKLEKRTEDGAGGSALPSFLASHPDTLERLERAKSRAEAGGFPAGGELTPLAEALAGESEAE